MASITQEGQWEIEGLVLGINTTYDVKDFSGLGAIDFRTSDDVRPSDHGSYLGEDFISAKKVILEVDILGATAADTQAAKAALALAWRPLSGSTWTKALKFRLPGIPQVRRLNGRPRRIAFDLKPFTAGTVMGVTLEYFANDPREYTDDLSSIQIPGGSPATGRTYNKVYNKTYGSSIVTPDTVTITNKGTFTTKPTVLIRGTVAQPYLIKTSTGEMLKLNNDVPITATDQLVIDFDARTIKFNGADRYYWLDQTSTWFELDPGDTIVKFGGNISAGSYPYALVSWRDAWL